MEKNITEINHDNLTITKVKKTENKQEYYKQYRQNKKEIIRGCNERYYNKNREEYQTCERCKCQIKGINMTQHRYTLKHQNNINSNSLTDEKHRASDITLGGIAV